MPSKRLYFDFAAGTPVDPVALRAMQPYFGEQFGNPGSLHSYGQEAVNALDRARETLAAAIGCNFREIVFTASATEANNLAIIGTLKKFREEHPEIARPRIIISAIEHESVMETVHALGDDQRENVEVITLPVDKEGYVDPQQLVGLVDASTVLVSVMYGNNEIGTAEPVAKIVHIVAALRSEGRTFAKAHTDAAQVFQFMPCSVGDLGVDLMTLSAQKIYGPKGAGLLYVRNLDTPRTMPLTPLIYGGGQEYGLRSGTENVPAIVGFAKAVELAVKYREKEAARLQKLKEYCWAQIKKTFPKTQVNGPRPHLSGHVSKILPHILNIYLPGHDAQDVITAFDLQSIAVSAGSACSARSLEPSPVIEALGYSKERARQSIRVSFGRSTTKGKIIQLVKALRLVLKR